MINPGFKGKQNPAVLYAARKCKIKEIYSIGGPSAIAAAAYGTKKIKSVNKIVGPLQATSVKLHNILPLIKFYKVKGEGLN